MLVGALGACASISADLTGTESRVALNGSVLSSGGPYQLRTVVGGVVTDEIVARSATMTKGGPQLQQQAYLPISAAFTLPDAGSAPKSRCLAIVDRNSLPVQIRRRGAGTALYAFSNPLWSNRLQFEERLSAATTDRNRAERELEAMRVNLPQAEQRLARSRAYANGSCTTPPQQPEPPRPANALDPSTRSMRVEQICERVAQQRLGCNVYVNMMRQMGLPATILACGQNRTVVPPDALTGWADFFENSFIQGCINNGNPISCGFAKSAFQSRQEHCKTEVARPFATAYSAWNNRVAEVRREPQQALQQCERDLTLTRTGPERLVSLAQRHAATQAALDAVKASAPALTAAPANLIDNLCN